MTHRTPSRDLRDAPYGWITDIPPDLTIDKDRAVRMYLLGPGDLDDVRFNDRFIESPDHSHYCNEYQERDVEWKAWEIHGGPVEYWTFLKRQKEAGEQFPCSLLPYSYRPGARYDLDLPTPPELQDRYVCDSAALRDARLMLPTWLWNECNAVLDRVFLGGQFPRTATDLTADRENAMMLAVAFIHGRHHTYAGRTNENPGSSPCIIQLRQILSEAPIVPQPGSREWGTTIAFADFVHLGARVYYDWNIDYLNYVFTAACEVVKTLGPDVEGWASARWEVYDKYSQLPGIGLYYDSATKTWSDQAAADWLGTHLLEDLQGHLRNRCAAGVAFNALLPLPGDPGSPS